MQQMMPYIVTLAAKAEPAKAPRTATAARVFLNMICFLIECRAPSFVMRRRPADLSLEALPKLERLSWSEPHLVFGPRGPVHILPKTSSIS